MSGASSPRGRSPTASPRGVTREHASFSSVASHRGHRGPAQHSSSSNNNPSPAMSSPRSGRGRSPPGLLNIDDSLQRRKARPVILDLTTLSPVELITHVLPEASLAELRDALRTGLPIDDFVTQLSELCSVDNPAVQRHIDFVQRSLRVLFGEIDVNGNGEVDWEEFTHHILHSTQAGAHGEGGSGGGSLVDAKRIAFDHITQLPVEGMRVYRRACTPLLFCDGWQCYAVIETIRSEGLTHTKVSLYKSVTPNPLLYLGTDRKPPPDLGLYAVCTLPFAVHSAAMVVSMRRLVLATATSKLVYLALHEDPLATSTRQLQRLEMETVQHLEGVFPCMTWDPESDKLFVGGSDGRVLVIDPYATHKLLPHTVLAFHAHCPAVAEMIVLPERGAKKIVVAGIDGRIRIFDLSHGGELLGEIGNCVSPCSMTFSEEYSVLITCTPGDPDPSVWSPHAVQNAFVRRMAPIGGSDGAADAAAADDEDGIAGGSAAHGAKSSPAVVLCVPRTPYCCIVDTKGIARWRDIRTMQDACAVRANGEPIVSAERMQAISCPAIAVDPMRLELLCIARQEASYTLNLFRSHYTTGHNPEVAHDSEVVGVCYVDALNWVITACRRALHVWDAADGGLLMHRLTHLWGAGATRRITTIAAESHGRRVLVGTYGGTVSLHSTSTGAELASFPVLNGPVTCLKILASKGLVLYSSPSGNFVAANMMDDPPTLYFRKQLDDGITGFDVTERMPLACVADSAAHLTEMELAATGAGSVVAVTPPPVDPFAVASGPSTAAAGSTAAVRRSTIVASANNGHHHHTATNAGGATASASAPMASDDIDLEAVMNPSKYETTAVAASPTRPYCVTGDARGFLHLVTVRPHAMAHTRFARWRTFCARGTSKTLFSVALAIAIDDETNRVYVGDDQGYITIWCVAELVAKTALVPIHVSGLRETMPIPEEQPLQLVPKLRGAFSVSESPVPIRDLVLLTHHNAVVASTDRSVTLWDLAGAHLGALVQGRYAGNDERPVAGGWYSFKPGGAHAEMVATGVPDDVIRGSGAADGAPAADQPPRGTAGSGLTPVKGGTDGDGVARLHTDAALKLMSAGKANEFVTLSAEAYARLFPPGWSSASSPVENGSSPQLAANLSFSASTLSSPARHASMRRQRSSRRFGRDAAATWHGTADIQPPDSRQRMNAVPPSEEPCLGTRPHTPVTRAPPQGRLASTMPGPFVDKDANLVMGSLLRGSTQRSGGPATPSSQAAGAKPTHRGVRELRPVRWTNDGTADSGRAASAAARSNSPVDERRGGASTIGVDTARSDATAATLEAVAAALARAIPSDGDATERVVFNRRPLERFTAPTTALATLPDRFASRFDWVGETVSRLALATDAEKRELPRAVHELIGFQPAVWRASRAGVRQPRVFDPSPARLRSPDASRTKSPADDGEDSRLIRVGTLVLPRRGPTDADRPASRTAARIVGHSSNGGGGVRLARVPRATHAAAAAAASDEDDDDTDVAVAVPIEPPAPSSTVCPSRRNDDDATSLVVVPSSDETDGAAPAHRGWLWAGTIAPARLDAIDAAARSRASPGLAAPRERSYRTYQNQEQEEPAWVREGRSLFVYERDEDVGAVRREIDRSLAVLRVDAAAASRATLPWGSTTAGDTLPFDDSTAGAQGASSSPPRRRAHISPPRADGRQIRWAGSAAIAVRSTSSAAAVERPRSQLSYVRRPPSRLNSAGAPTHVSDAGPLPKRASTPGAGSSKSGRGQDDDFAERRDALRFMLAFPRLAGGVGLVHRQQH